jgi:exodeoxyribonuclease V beta subunit
VSLVISPARSLHKSPLTRLLLRGEAPADAKAALGALREEARALAAQLPAAISLRTLPEPDGVRYRPETPGRPRLACSKLRRSYPDDEHVASFSALASHTTSHSLDEALDHDADAAPAVDAPLALSGFPRGARAGQLIHEAIERVEFDAEVSSVRAALTEFERTQRVSAGDADALAAALVDVFACPLAADGPRLADVPRARRVDELEFLLPVPGRFDPAALALAFEGELAPPFAPSYGARLRELGFARFGGFLRGFIDLVFEHEGRYFLVDYKSSDLGARAADYAPARLVEPMVAHHYVLQYHLYALALHRQLGLRMRGYDFERHFGGVYYLFLRGMAPQHPAHNGVFFERPTLARLDALARMLEATP